MTVCKLNNSRYRLLNSLFSRATFSRILNYSDFSTVESVISETGCGRSRCRCVGDYYKWAYGQLLKFYPCEYVYKNEFLNRVVLKDRIPKQGVIFNEFKAAGVIADFAVIGKESCAYEIKTRLDSPKRLSKQIEGYAKIFDSVSLIVPAEKIEIYNSYVPEQIGLIAMFNDYCGVTFEELRTPDRFGSFDVSEMMKILYTHEYRKLVVDFCGRLPSCDNLSMYPACSSELSKIPVLQLKEAFLKCLTQRVCKKKSRVLLRASPLSLRQVVVSLGLSLSEIVKIQEFLSLPLRKSHELPICSIFKK